MKKKVLMGVAVLVLLVLISLMLMIIVEYQDEKDENVVIPEEQKVANTESSVESVRLQIVPLIAEARWPEASDILMEYFSTHKTDDEEGWDLFEYYMDVTLLCNMGMVDPDLYSEVFNSFKSPEPFIAAMVYYPASVKMSAILSYDSLVPTTSGNDLQIFQKKDATEDMISYMKMDFDDFKEASVYEVMIDGVLFDFVLMERQDETYGLWFVECIEGESYFMSVAEWIELLKDL